MNLREANLYLDRLQRFGIKLGLENIQALLDALGRPERSFPSVHIAGTNGKGSVSAMIASALRRSGLKVGLYTSPHLARVEERITVDGVMIPARRFLGRLRRAIDLLTRAGKLVYHPTYFEVLTALGFLHFAEEKADVGVIEVGLGGRFDATNTLEPLVSVITTIAKDHEKHLGHTLREIAFEKAGIIKPGRPVVCGVRSEEALAEIRRVAAERRAPLTEVFGRGRSLRSFYDGGRYRFVYQDGRTAYSLRPSLAGRHQGDNAAVAVAALRVLGEVFRPIAKKDIIAGIENTVWEGRLETVSRKPLVVLDGAHNEEGAEALAGYIKEAIGRPVILVFAVMKDKDIPAMAGRLFELAELVVLTKAPYKRSAPPEDIAPEAERAGRRYVCEPDVRKAVKAALRESAGRVPVVIAGSLFLVGEVKRLGLFG
jgi:dihydrofolate synthase/folylpolyglutamate synthase